MFAWSCQFNSWFIKKIVRFTHISSLKSTNKTHSHQSLWHYYEVYSFSGDFQMFISSSYCSWNSAVKLAIVASRTFEVNSSSIKSYKAGRKQAFEWVIGLHSYYSTMASGLRYYSNMATGLVTIPTWKWARLLFQHGVGLDRTLLFGPTNYEQCLHLSEWVSDAFAYWSPRKKLISTLRIATSLKIMIIKGNPVTVPE